MGNQLSGIAPAQILGVENYIIDVPELRYESSLGSTRFLKVARAKHKEGYVVIKVFVLHDPSLPLASYQERINQIASLTVGLPNILPFQRSLMTDRAGLLIRQYVHDNLYDRTSTRPFLTVVEKKWIVFQLLCALDQLHSLKIYHGDIKSNNIMMTSWNWAMLTDIASFKPVFLPADNPADFNYFFDTSRKRLCYIAPERFVDVNVQGKEDSLAGEDFNKDSSRLILPMQDFPEASSNELTKEMDIFSVGCVISELFCDGVGLFDLSQLLAYRTGDFNPETKLQKIDDGIKDMICHMIQLDPNNRLSAKEYMTRYRGTIFPEEFYSFLKNYFAAFASAPVLTPDEKIAKLAKDMETIKNALHVYIEDKDDKLSGDELERKEIPLNDNCFVMVVSLVTSSVRNLKFTISKLTSLDLMLELAHYVNDEIVLELLLPHMFYLVNDKVPRVRAKTITTICRCVQLVTVLPKNDVNIFPEYILPKLSSLANDPEVVVQCAFAENVALLAETALRFLELAQLNYGRSDRDEQSQYQVSYDLELDALHELIQNKVVSLLTNTNNIVKRTLMKNGLTRLCVFFGRQKANDVLLSHIITFLNDKHDWQIRADFFGSIVGIAVYIGCQSLTILNPLLQTGLKDTEEFVVHSALKALISLVELRLLQKHIIYEFIDDVSRFLCHPNRWVRYGAVGYVIACAKVMSPADVQCRLAPSVQPYLKQPLIQFDNQTVLLSILDDPIPRLVFDYVIKSPQAWTFLQRLEHHHHQNPETHFVPSSNEALSQIVRKLKSQGMNYKVEKKLIKLKDVILRLNNYKTNPDMQQAGNDEQLYPGLLDLSSLPSVLARREIDLCKMAENRAEAKQQQIQSGKRQSSKQSVQGPAQFGVSIETKEMDEDRGTSVRIEGEGVATVYTAMTDQAKYAKCKQDVRKLAFFKRDQYVSDIKKRTLLGNVMGNKNKPNCWKPKGQLVAHLHEHKAAINRIVLSDDCKFFATASDDSTVKIWDTNRLDGKALTTRSKYNYTKQVGKINCLTFCQGSKTLACSSDDASIHVFNIEGGSGANKLPLKIEKKLNLQEEGIAVDMHQFDTGSQSIIAYATVHGYLCGWDLRVPKEKFAWKLKNDNKLGLISSFTVDTLQCWITCGTTDGALVCWDMRFQLPITQIVHKENARVRRVTHHPLQPSWIVASFQGNNEISMWDLETAAKKHTLWASQYPPLTYSQPSHETVLALHGAHNGQSASFITAGTDKRIRYWDLGRASESAIITGSATDNLDHWNLRCNNRMIDGTEVFYETYEKKPSGSSQDDRTRRGIDEPPTGHHDSITDIAITKLPQNLLISCAKDGVIKVWK